MKEKYESAEALLDYAIQAQICINRIDAQYNRIVFECGPSGYVGCSNECRGSGLRRRSGSMMEIVDYLTELGKKKDRLIIFLKPLICAFEDMKNSRDGHIIYHMCGKGLSAQEYGEKFGYSRRHVRRMYIRALTDLYNNILRNDGDALLNKFSI